MRIMMSEKIMIVSEYLNVMLQNTENNYQNVINYVKHLRPLSLLRKVEIFPRRGTLYTTCFKSVVFCLVACGLVKTYGHASVLLLSNCT